VAKYKYRRYSEAQLGVGRRRTQEAGGAAGRGAPPPRPRAQRGGFKDRQGVTVLTRRRPPLLPAPRRWPANQRAFGEATPEPVADPAGQGSRSRASSAPSIGPAISEI